MTRKLGIRAPRRPKDESAAVTIANQDKQIRLLIDRCAKLDGVLTAANDLIDDIKGERDAAVDKNISLALTCDGMQEVHQRMLGWQDCAREIFGIVGLPLIAPGA